MSQSSVQLGDRPSPATDSIASGEALRPAADTRLWWTLRRPVRPLAYSALRQVLNRANATLGSNITFHDLRHTTRCG